MATRQHLEKIAARVLPEFAPDFALLQKNLFLARVMSTGSLEEANLVVEHFGMQAMRAVLSNPPPRIFDRESWNYWHTFLGLTPATMPDGFFTVQPWFKDRMNAKRQITSQVLNHLPDYGRTPLYSEDRVGAN